MPEILEDRKIYSLLEVSRGIQETIARKFPESYWIKAEMHKLGFFAQSGHCFPELVEKRDGKIIAKVDALIWRQDFLNINLRFKNVLNEGLKDGIKILFLAKVEYSPEFGLKLRMVDIDPSFTLGDFERERQESIKRLQAEGIFEKNKSLEFPLLPQRIAIISDRDSRGYQDFINVIDAAANSWGYNFFHMLFTASLQGDKALVTIPEQLDKIQKVKDHFDIVAIIRGGGGELSFACYNNYELSKKIAAFPLPVVTGIGHVTNMTVVDMVANQSSITPTKLAESIIQMFHNFSVTLKEFENKIKDQSARLIADEKSKFESGIKLFRSVTTNLLLKNKNALKEHSQTLKKDSLSFLKQNELVITLNKTRINTGYKVFIKSKKSDLAGVEKNVNNLNPKNVLKRGYSITQVNGKSVTASGKLKRGDTLHTLFYDGSVLSTVNSTSKQQEQ